MKNEILIAVCGQKCHKQTLFARNFVCLRQIFLRNFVKEYLLTAKYTKQTKRKQFFVFCILFRVFRVFRGQYCFNSF